MIRILSVLVLALWCSQAALTVAVVALDDSCQSCPDDDEQGCHCPPGCGCCTRCVHGTPAIPPSTLALPLISPPFLERLLPSADRAPSAPEPIDIQHVPKHALA